MLKHQYYLLKLLFQTGPMIALIKFSSLSPPPGVFLDMSSAFDSLFDEQIDSFAELLRFSRRPASERLLEDFGESLRGMRARTGDAVERMAAGTAGVVQRYARDGRKVPEEVDAR